MHVGFFDPNVGGDPLLFQHLFWFYSHPAVYIMVLPGMAAVSEIVACFSRKRIFGYTFVAFASIAIAVLGFSVWAHHMFIAGVSAYATLVYSLMSYLVSVPSAIKVLQLDGDNVQGKYLVSNADAVCARVHWNFLPWVGRVCFWLAWALTSTLRTHTS
jgi:cytochrome c oxidase subunit 1